MKTVSSTEEKKESSQQRLVTHDDYTPLKSLNTFFFDWKIKVRLTKKCEKKNWKNAKGSGTLLNIELIDALGTQIQATMFNEAVERLDHLLDENKVYLISNGQVKMANQKFTSIKNDYALILDNNSQIMEIDDDLAIQNVGFDFTGLDEVANFE